MKIFLMKVDTFSAITKNKMRCEMLKKIVLGTILVGLSSLLVVGAINRTEAISGRSETTSARSQGEGARGQNSSGDEATSGNQHGNGGNSLDTATATTAEGNGNGRNGQGNQGISGGGGNQVSLLEAEVEEWLPLEGTVQSVTDEALALILPDDEQILVEGRAWKYALESGFTTEVDNQILVTGFYEDGEFKFGSLEDLSTGLEATLRDASGRPMWSGGWGQGGA